MAERIKLPFPELLEQKVTQPIQHYIDLEESYLRRVYEFYADEVATDEDGEPDKSMPWEKDVYTFSNVVALRQWVVGTEVSYVSISKVWLVLIAVNGFETDLKVYFRSQANAMDLADKINKWIHAYN